VVITDPKQIADPLSEALALVANDVGKLRERVTRLEGGQHASESLHPSVQNLMDDLDYQI
jgi:3-phenylpropionate/cinnamic acid dioxygenase small subunit